MSELGYVDMFTQMLVLPDGRRRLIVRDEATGAFADRPAEQAGRARGSEDEGGKRW